MFIAWLLLALIAGIGLPVQIGLNNELRRWLGDPVYAATTSFIIGSFGLLAVSALVPVPLPAAGHLARAPWWAWVGGLIGAFYVFATIFLAPKLGAALLLSVTVGGQMLAALVLDHYGSFGFPQQPMSFGRIAGALLIVVGVVLVRRF